MTSHPSPPSSSSSYPPELPPLGAVPESGVHYADSAPVMTLIWILDIPSHLTTKGSPSWIFQRLGTIQSVVSKREGCRSLSALNSSFITSNLIPSAPPTAVLRRRLSRRMSPTLPSVTPEVAERVTSRQIPRTSSNPFFFFSVAFSPPLSDRIVGSLSHLLFLSLLYFLACFP